MSLLPPTDVSQTDDLRNALRDYWGYDDFLPLQQEAMSSVLGGRDSLVVLPTGGGKSLCFQAPALCMDGMAIVVSPLISLMKDQVDALRACGVSAACLNSTLPPQEARDVIDQVRAGSLKLLYVAPERLTLDGTLTMLANDVRVSFVAVDEAHCVSMWGHDFRPHYRELRVLKEVFPGIGVHGYTATATLRVRQDVARQLALENPEVLVGSFDRPNLSYTTARQNNRLGQIAEVLDRHPGESGIIYCISRKNVEETSGALNAIGYNTLPYHAGLSDETRHANQEAFIQEQTDTIVATIAFGMGIDKSNVRYVVHAGLPKSLENYQQESGRAGRDGLEAECALIYSGQDAVIWKRIFSEQTGDVLAASLRSLDGIVDYCHSQGCRHRALVRHFGQDLDADCETSCDNCRGDIEMVDDPLVVGQKILSSVVRQEQRFGATYTVKVLKGSSDQQVLQNGHDHLSTYGILRDESAAAIREWIEQLIGQGFLTKTPGEYPLLQLADAGWQLLRGEGSPKLSKPVSREARRERDVVPADSWEGVDRELFETLRAMRMEMAAERSVPPYVIFSDVALRDMARRRPSNLMQFIQCRGVGEKKRDDFGAVFIDTIVAHCKEHGLETDVESPADSAGPSSQESRPEPRERKLTTAAVRAFPLFEQGLSLDVVAREIERAPSTVSGYLIQYIDQNHIDDATDWVEPPIARRVEEAVLEIGGDRLKPIYDALNEEVSYDMIRIVAACMRNRE